MSQVFEKFTYPSGPVQLIFYIRRGPTSDGRNLGMQLILALLGYLGWISALPFAAENKNLSQGFILLHIRVVLQYLYTPFIDGIPNNAAQDGLYGTAADQASGFISKKRLSGLSYYDWLLSWNRRHETPELSELSELFGRSGRRGMHNELSQIRRPHWTRLSVSLEGQSWLLSMHCPDPWRVPPWTIWRELRRLPIRPRRRDNFDTGTELAECDCVRTPVWRWVV